MELKTYFAQDAAGNIISSAIVNVFLQGTTTLATGLTRADGTPLENPFAADGAGRIQFRAPDGYYDVQVSGGPGIIQTLTIQCVDYSEAKADADRAEEAADRADVSAEQVADAVALRGEISDPDGAEKYPELQVARWRNEGDVRGWGAICDGVNDDSDAVIDAMLASAVIVKLPAGKFKITKPLPVSNRPLIIQGSGQSNSVLEFYGSSTAVMFQFSVDVDTHDSITLQDFTIQAKTASNGTAIRMTGNAASISATQVVAGVRNKLAIDRVSILGTRDSAGGFYWTKSLDVIDAGGVSINGFTINNETTAAQSNVDVRGIKFSTTDPKVSVVRALNLNDFYILRTYIAIEAAPISASAGGITSWYVSKGEIVGHYTGFQARKQCNAMAFTNVHFDSIYACLDFSSASVSNSRFTACDFRKGKNGGSYTAGAMVILDYGEQNTFGASTFSGINLDLADTTNNAFGFTNTFNGSWPFLLSITGNTFTKFNNVLGDVGSSSLIKLSGNSYNQIADAVTFNGNTATNFTIDDIEQSKTVVQALVVGSNTISFPIVANRFKSAPSLAMLSQQNNPSQPLTIIYDYSNSNSSQVTFIITGVTKAGNFRFGLNVR